MAVEAFTEFPVLEKGEFYTPSHLYEIQYAKFRQPRNEVYFGVPVSSGGMRRLVQPDNLANIGIGNPEAKLLIKAYQYIQRNGDPNINGVSFTPPFVNKPESASLIELIPLDEHKTSHKESLFEVKNGAALRIAAWRERLKAADGFGSLVADFPAETKFEVHEGIITMGNLQLEPENLAAALLEATIIDDRVTVCYPLIESGGTRLITFTISTEDKNRLLSVCL